MADEEKTAVLKKKGEKCSPIVEGVAMCLLVMYAPSLATGISQVMSGTASGATITAIREAVAAGSVVITSVNPYTIGAVSGLAY